MEASRNLLEFVVWKKNKNNEKLAWEVMLIANNTNLGMIYWYEFWRKFVFRPDLNNIFTADILEELSLFMKQKTEERNAK